MSAYPPPFISTMIGATLMMVALGLVFAVLMPGMERWSKRFFVAFFSLHVAYDFLALIEVNLPVSVTPKAVIDLIYVLETVAIATMSPMTTAFLLSCCGRDWRRDKALFAESALWFASLAMCVVATFTSFFYSTTPDGVFVRGPLYPLMVLVLEAMLVINLVVAIRHREGLTKRYFHVFLVAFLPSVVVMFFQLFTDVLVFFGLAEALSALTVFMTILVVQVNRNIRQQREIANQRASIMVLQMRPHFICNTMMSIYYLCEQDPSLAQQVTLDFTNYLRKNLNGIAHEGLIPFTEELEHTRAYLNVEKAQFDGDLVVEFDTPHVDFLLPPLTLQPIVENAVKHGMDPDTGPLHVYVRTQAHGHASEVIVENDGCDFVATDDDGHHVGLSNIRQRLRLMCDGKLTIEPREGGGTIVRVWIP